MNIYFSAKKKKRINNAGSDFFYCTSTLISSISFWSFSFWLFSCVSSLSWFFISYSSFLYCSKSASLMMFSISSSKWVLYWIFLVISSSMVLWYSFLLQKINKRNEYNIFGYYCYTLNSNTYIYIDFIYYFSASFFNR